MKKKRFKEINADVATGVSSTAGAVAGGVLGNVFAQEARASEMADESDVESVEVVQSQPQPEFQSEPESEPGNEVKPEPEPVAEPKPESGQESDEQTSATGQDSDVQVLSYETVENIDGSQMDVAVVAVNGTPTIVADVDMDGTADLMAADINGNQQIDADEVVDISAEGIAMAPLKQEMENDSVEDLVQTDDSDYINDADVDDYMA